MKLRWTHFIPLLAAALIGGLGFLVFAFSGVYDIAASSPHARAARWVLEFVKQRSIKYHARELEVPELNDERLIRRGLLLYEKNCVTCHGAPGQAPDRLGIGLLPFPPPQETTAEDWTPAEIAWITANGIKMAGMPAFTLGEEPNDLWAMTAFVLRINSLTPADYQKMKASLQTGREADVRWKFEENQGWSDLEKRGDKAKGKKLAKEYGCASCHQIPSITGRHTFVGPPLTNWSKRHYIAGSLINTPNNLVRWIQEPDKIEPGTLMPDLHVQEDEAWHIARFLFD